MLAQRITDLCQRSQTGDESLKVVDVCTGSGCVALTIANQCTKGKLDVFGIDSSRRALRLAKANLRRNAGGFAPSTTINFKHMDVFTAEFDELIRSADVVAMNPPYIPKSEYQFVSLSTRRFEPHDALMTPETTIDDGNAFYWRVLDTVQSCHPPRQAILAFETGSARQAVALKTRIEQSPGWEAQVWRDSAERDRCVFATLRPYVTVS